MMNQRGPGKRHDLLKIASPSKGQIRQAAIGQCFLYDGHSPSHTAHFSHTGLDITTMFSMIVTSNWEAVPVTVIQVVGIKDENAHQKFLGMRTNAPAATNGNRVASNKETAMACPKCGAAPGHTCKSKKGYVVKIHAARLAQGKLESQGGK